MPHPNPERRPRRDESAAPALLRALFYAVITIIAIVVLVRYLNR